MSPSNGVGGPFPLPVQAADRASLRQRLAALPERAARSGLPALARALASEAEVGLRPARAALVVAGPDELEAKVALAAGWLSEGTGRWHDPRGVSISLRPVTERGRLAFLFPGDGSPYVGMMAGLRDRFPSLQGWLRRADEVARRQGRATLTETVYPSDLSQEKVRHRAEHRLRRLEHSSTAVLAFNQGLVTVLGEFGICPDALIGHSLGDWSALAAGGVTEAENFMEHVDQALLLPGHVTQPNARMGLVMAPREVVEEVLATVSGAVYVAMDNGPKRIVIAGDKPAVRVAMERFAARGVVAHRLPFVRAAHTPLCAAVREPLQAAFERWSAHLPTHEIWSCASAARYPNDLSAIRRLAVDNIVGCVEYAATVKAAWESGIRIFVECGARGQLADCIPHILGDREVLALALNHPAKDDLTIFCRTLAILMVEGVPVRWSHWFGEAAATPAEAPAGSGVAPRPRRDATPVVASLADSASAMQRHHAAVLATLRAGTDFTADWMRTQQAALVAHFAGRAAAAPESPAVIDVPGPFLAEVTAADDRVTARVELDAARQPWLWDHSFGWFHDRLPTAAGPLPVAPMTVLIEILAEAAAVLSEGQPLRAIEQVVIRRSVQARTPRELVVQVSRQADGSVATQLLEPGSEQVLAEAVCEFGPRPPAPEADDFRPAGAVPVELTAAQLYADRIMFHGPCYQVIEDLGEIGPDGIVGLLRTRPAEELFGAPPAAPLLTDPTLFDAVGQLFGYWALVQYEKNRVVFPTHVGRIELYGDPPPADTAFRTSCRVRQQTAKRLIGDLELSAEGRVFARLRDWGFWRFNWPTSLMTFARFPARLFPTRPLTERFRGLGDLPWSAEFAQARPVELLEFIVPALLCQSELARYESFGAETRRQQFFFGRLAAKDALRRWAEAVHGRALSPTAIELPPADGPPQAQFADWTPPAVPYLSLAHVAGLAAAVVDDRPIGLDLEPLAERDEAFCQIAFTPAELATLGPGARPRTAGWCAKEAAAKASGRGLTDPRRWQLEDFSEDGCTVVDDESRRWTVRIADDSEFIIAVARPAE